MLIEGLKNLSSAEAKDMLIQIYSQYISPSFGAMSKREIDIIMFSQLMNHGIFNGGNQSYNIQRELKITKPKTSNLLYEYNLRKADDESLKAEVRELLKEPLLDKVSSTRKVGLEVENPLLKDHIRNLLKQKGHITDTSFNNDILYMSFDAYSYLFYEYSGIDNKEVKNLLIEQGIATGASDIGDKALDFLLTKLAGDKSKEVYDTFKQFLKDRKTTKKYK